jgi:hypothetical protein
MKKTKIIYWVATCLFGAFMLFSAIPDIMMVPDAVTFMTGHLGYPEYFIPFIGVAKALGVLALLLPGFPRIKEWAYAGLVFDLIGATYSVISVDGFNASLLFMALPLGCCFLSYIYFHKLQAMRTRMVAGKAVNHPLAAESLA